jgi:flavin-dependent dehydrogenase
MENHEIVIIGAGPAGAVAAGLLRRQGHQVLVLERQRFPRFSIGESLLAHCIEFIEEAGMLPAVEAAGFQVKNGAAFAWGERYTAFDFRDKVTPGPGTTFQVLRARFDKILADEAARQGAEVRYEQEVVAADFAGPTPVLSVRDAGVPDAPARRIGARFVLDASGYGRVLARLLDLERPSGLPPRKAIFTHVEDRIADPSFDREKILITVHPDQPGIWYWLIPFSDGRCSLGVVGGESLLGDDADHMASLRRLVDAAPNLKRLLADAVWDTPANTLGGYAASVTRLHGPGYALLGNAAEFLDPVFSSGVTIALHSSKLATDALHRQLQGQPVDWEADFAAPLMRGVETFRTYVEGWYAGTFRDVVFYERAQPDIRRMISSILAGYAWDRANPFVAEHARRLRALAEICAPRPPAAATT